MGSVTGLHDSGQHMLGPHVVGQRVVVRRLLRGQTGPTGGPAFTDLLGTCLAWGDGACVVQPEQGEPVTIALADIVSGKPVPPRPQVHQRIPVRDTELHVTSLWPGLEVEELGEWVLRFDPTPRERPFKRANSALAIGSPGVDVAEALAHVAEFYTSRGRTPLLHVPADEATAYDGWAPVPGGDAVLMVGSTSRVARSLRGRRPTGIEALLAGERPVQVGTSTEGPRLTVELRRDDDLLATGRAALDGDWLGLHDLWVAEPLRRRGLATRVLEELLGWGAEQGATTVWLHVETGNVAARALHESLGLRPHHEVRYLSPVG